MTVAATAPRNDYVGNGATATYSYSFKVFAATDLRVTVRDTNNVETTLTYPTDYTVTGAGRANGGTITLTAGVLAQDYALTIRFDRTPLQSTDLRNQGSFFPEVHEDKFDELTRYAQQNKDTLDRSLHLPETEVGTAAATTLPVAEGRASKYLAFDIDGNPIALAAAATQMPIFTGRFYHNYTPEYDLASGLLSVMHYLQSGTITVPTGKQHNVLRFDGTVTGGNKFKGIDWQYTITDSVDAYCAIGLLINQGSGSTKALYGRAQASTGCTGVVVGLVSGCTVDSGVVPSTAMGLQISMDGAGTATEHSAIRIDTAEASKVVTYGLLSLGEVGYSNAFIKGFRRSGAGGNAFEWTDQSTSRDLFVIDENGNVAIGAVADPQKTLTLANGNRLFVIQAATAGDLFRITAGSVGDILKVGCVANNLAECSLSVWGNNTASGQASLQVSLGAVDSGGAGYRCLRVVN